MGYYWAIKEAQITLNTINKYMWLLCVQESSLNHRQAQGYNEEGHHVTYAHIWESLTSMDLICSYNTITSYDKLF